MPKPAKSTPRNRRERRREATLTRPLPDSDSIPDRLTRRQAADYLSSIGCPITEKTLAMYSSRAHVEGPLYAIVNGGRAIYERADLDAWAASRTSPKARTRAQHEDRDIATRRAAV
jgi:hypothetical protein